MNPRCKAQVTAVLSKYGKTATKATLNKVQAKLAQAANALALSDPQYLSLPDADKAALAAKLAGQFVVKQANYNAQRVVATVNARANMEAFVTAHPGGIKEAIINMIFEKTGRKVSFAPMESKFNSIKDEALSKLDGLFDLGNMHLGLSRDPKFIDEFTDALYGNRTGKPPKMLKLIDEMQAVHKNLSQQLEDAGGAINELDNWRMMQTHDADKLQAVGKQPWIDFHMTALDRKIYLHDTGRPLTDGEMRAFLDHSFETLISNGANKVAPGGLANRGKIGDRSDKSRQLHYRDAKSHADALKRFSDKGIIEQIVGSIEGLSREIAALKTFGPDARGNLEYAIDLHKLKLIKEGQADKGIADAAFLNQMKDYALGQTEGPINPRIAKVAAASRSLMTAAAMGRAVISSLGDEVTMAAGAAATGQRPWAPLMQEFKLLTSASEREIARRMALGMEAAVGQTTRFTDSYGGNGKPAKLASAVLKYTGLTGISAIRKQGFGIVMLDAIGKSVDRAATFADAFQHGDEKIMASKGVTEQDFNIWKLAPLDRTDGHTLLFPPAVRALTDAQIRSVIGANATESQVRSARNDAVHRLTGIAQDEANIAVPTAGWWERARAEAALGGPKRGTYMGEIKLSALQFKSTALATILRQYGRVASGETAGNRYVYGATLLAGSIMMGAAMEQLYAVAAGKSPPNWVDHPGQNFVKALMRGGALGIFGDILTQGTNEYGTNFLSGLAGPGFQVLNDVADMTQGNVRKALKGEDTNFVKKATQLTKRFTPGSNMPVIGNAMNLLVFDQLNEYANPGYHKRRADRLRKESGQEYYSFGN